MKKKKSDQTIKILKLGKKKSSMMHLLRVHNLDQIEENKDTKSLSKLLQEQEYKIEMNEDKSDPFPHFIENSFEQELSRESSKSDISITS